MTVGAIEGAAIAANAAILTAAQKVATTLSGVTKASAMSCVTLKENLHRGAETDSVTKLQQFLADKGLLSEKPSGFFGDLTITAVKAYQKSLGLKETGMVYDATRQAIKDETCQ
jgi:peptidoglycan hydrolase-like protein with peptidoglycan-binding domain